MNKLVTFLVMFFSVSVFSQFTVSTKLIEVFAWNEDKDDWGDVLDEYAQYAFFEFNEEMTFLEFTTNKTKTSYILTEEEYSEEYDHYSYNATSDGGFEALLILDLKLDTPNIRLVVDSDEMALLIRYTSKHHWFEDEE
jgi:hypothetical protein